MKLINLWEADLRKAYDLFQSFPQEENGFENDGYGLSFDEFPAFVEKRKNYSFGIGMREGRVPSSDYILEDQGNYVGIFKFRHHLNEFLENGAGHIGYGISKNYRGQGYATKGLALMIEIAKEVIPEDEIYMAVYKDNKASLKTQLNNGAYIHHEDDTEYFTRIKIKREAFILKI